MENVTGLVETAMGLRRWMAQNPCKEDELRSMFKHMPSNEQMKFFDMYDNPEVRDIETFIGWLKVLKVI